VEFTTTLEEIQTLGRFIYVIGTLVEQSDSGTGSHKFESTGTFQGFFSERNSNLIPWNCFREIIPFDLNHFTSHMDTIT